MPGALFRSIRYRCDETELVILVTPYLVEPVDTSRLATPDGLPPALDAPRPAASSSDRAAFILRPLSNTR